MDSSVLAAVALELRDRLPPLHFLHVNYGLRRPDCDREEAMLRQWAEKEGVPIEILRLAPKGKPENLQAWAREKRFEFFRRTVEKRNRGQGTVWLAHHRRDQAETFLLRLLRGAGLGGLAGMKVLEDLQGLQLFRPFLEVPYESLKIYAKNHRVLFRQDKSNFTDLYLRNRVRRRLVPALRKENPSIEETLSLLAERLGQSHDALQALAEQWLRRRKGNRLGLAALRRQVPGLQVAILQQWTRLRVGESQSWNEILPRLLKAIGEQKSVRILLRGGSLKLSPENLEYLGP